MRLCFSIHEKESHTSQLLCVQDIANDELADPAVWSRLLSWHTITVKELAEVFPSEHGTVVEAARHLIRWCLKGDPTERPTMNQVVEHPFLTSTFDGRELAGALRRQPQMPMKYRAFLSHAQVLFLILQQLKLWNPN